MPQKNKGTNAERDLVHRFWSTGSWAAHRIAGSGSSKYPSPDIIASNNLRRLAIECKSSKKNSVYIPNGEISALQDFAHMFGAEPWVAVRFSRQEWFFISLDDMNATAGNHSVSLQLARQKGLLFEELAQ
jgi:Holliday junction resolvase